MRTLTENAASITRTIETVTRQDVRVSRKYGWVVVKTSDSIAGCVWTDTTADGRTIWRASSGDIAGWSDTRAGAIETVIDLHNMQEKARGYDLLARLVTR